VLYPDLVTTLATSNGFAIRERPLCVNNRSISATQNRLKCYVRTSARNGHLLGRIQLTASADEGAFVFDEGMDGYGAEPTPERPADDACERQLVAARCRSRPTTGVPAFADCARSTTARFSARWTALQIGCVALHQGGLNASICQAERGHTATAPGVSGDRLAPHAG
jgi:hypothetical protein